MKQLSIILLSGLLLYAGSTQAQGTDKEPKARANVIRYNVSSAALFGFDKAFILGYERRVSKNQTFSVNFGTTALPRIIGRSSDSFQVSRNLKNNGYNFSADYRFYLGKLNKYSAPRGVYIGPYYSMNTWRRETTWESDYTGDLVNTNMKFNLHMAGLEFGYQFVFYNRVTLDLVLLGPGVGFYNIKATSEGTLTQEQRDQLRELILDKLQQKFPGLSYVLEGKQLDSQGTLTTNSVGFRYLIHIGFAF